MGASHTLPNFHGGHAKGNSDMAQNKPDVGAWAS